MRLRGSNILGLAIDDRGIRCAEIVAQGSRRLVRKLARFSFPPEAMPTAPAACGAALKAFLERHDIPTRRVVIGVPARWLIAQDRELPPADRSTGVNMLRLHGERMAAGGGGELVVDVAGDVVPNVATRALLVGILKPQLDRILAIATAAELDVVAVTSTSLAMHAATGAATRGEGMVLLGEGGTEVVGAGPFAARLLRHAPGVSAGAPTSVGMLGSELRRAITLGGLLPAEGSRSLVVWNGVELPPAMLRELSEKSGAELRVTEGQARAIGVEVSPIALNGEASQTQDAFLPAIALASGQALPIDFLDSRLAPPKERRFGRRSMIAAAIAVLVIGGLIALYQLIVSTEREAADLEQRASLREKPTRDAKAETARLEYGRSYFENRPPILQGLREVTLAFNFNEAIWATSFQLRENGRGVLQGKAADQRLVLDLRERLSANPKLNTVTVQELQQAGTRGGAGGGGGGGNRAGAGEQSFRIEFNYVGNE